MIGEEKTNIENELKEFKFNNVNLKGVIREFANRYEFYFIEDYEEKFNNFICHIIQLQDIFVQLLEIGNELRLASLDFPKTKFTANEVASWFDKFEIKLFEQDKLTIDIKEASKIIAGIKFKGNSLVLVEKGKGTIYCDTNLFTDISSGG